MRLNAFSLLALLISTAFVHAVDTPELTKLQENYKAAVERELKPLSDTYRKELEKLRDGYTRAAKLEAAIKVQAEIDALALAPLPLPMVNKQAVKAANPNHPPLEWIAGKRWISKAGTKWLFAEDGSGDKIFGDNKTTFTWRLMDSGLVEVLGRNTPDSPQRTWHLQFTSETEAVYGDPGRPLSNGMRRD